MKSQKNYKRIVVKIGSKLIAEQDGRCLDQIIKQLIELQDLDKEVILVSSGAIASALKKLNLSKRPKALSDLQALAAFGQVELMNFYREIFLRFDKRCAQVLLTRDDFDDRRRYLNAKNTISKLISMGIVAVVNENDTISVDEIKFGDNDILSALVAILVEADLLVILSTVDGLYEIDKKTKKWIKLICNVENITEDIHKMSCKISDELSIGGMSSKINAAKIATNVGVKCILANGTKSDVLLDIAKGHNPGTEFSEKSKGLVSRKRWIAFGTTSKGKIVVDNGAKEALLNRDCSLLAPGVIKVEGDFQAKDVVSIVDEDHNEFARGITNFSGKLLDETKGKRAKKEVVHRNDLVLLV